MKSIRLQLIRRLLWFAIISICVSLHAQTITLPAHPGSVRFAAIGDMGTGKTPEFQVAEKMQSVRKQFPFDFVIMLGDNIYGGNGAADFIRKFELPYKALLDGGVKFYASLGNHDSSTEKTYKPFNMNGQQYYTFKKGNAQFFALDSNYMDPQQLSWLTKELETSHEDWKICYFHHPLYSSAGFHGPSLELRMILEPLFIKTGVQVSSQDMTMCMNE
jgi:predicted MPP superfamily phosphohydrolase